MRLIIRRKLLKLVVLLCATPFILHMIVSKPRESAKEKRLKTEKGSWNITSTKLNYSYDNVHGLTSLQTRSPKEDKDLHLHGNKAAIEYCNSPSMIVTGEEGRTLERFKLRNVHVFINHGDRTPVHRLPVHNLGAYDCKFITWYKGSNEKFKEYAVQMNKMIGKQGRRNHFLNWSLYPDREICVGSVLTSSGALQHLKLGQYLFDSYNKHTHLFNRKLSLHNQIRVKSTSTSRTYQSAVAFLYGFLPSFNISQVKIEHSSDLHFCTKEYSLQKSCFCKHGKTLKIRSEKFQNQFERNKTHLRKRLASVLQLSDAETAPSITALAEALIPSICHNTTVSCSITESHNCQTFIRVIWNAVIAKELYKSEDTDQNYLKYSSIVMTPVLVEIIHRIRDSIGNRHVPKFVLYSGHDVTLTPLLYVLGLQDGRWPPYASRVTIELFEYQNDTSYDRYYLRFLYNGIDRTEDVLFCRRTTFKGLCNFNKFTEFVFTKMLRRFGFHNYYDACST